MKILPFEFFVCCVICFSFGAIYEITYTDEKMNEIIEKDMPLIYEGKYYNLTEINIKNFTTIYDSNILIISNP